MERAGALTHLISVSLSRWGFVMLHHPLSAALCMPSWRLEATSRRSLRLTTCPQRRLGPDVSALRGRYMCKGFVPAAGQGPVCGASRTRSSTTPTSAPSTIPFG